MCACAHARVIALFEKEMPFPGLGEGIFTPWKRHLFAQKKAPFSIFERSKMKREASKINLARRYLLFHNLLFPVLYIHTLLRLPAKATALQVVSYFIMLSVRISFGNRADACADAWQMEIFPLEDTRFTIIDRQDASPF
jgi:hypothetical protein